MTMKTLQTIIKKGYINDLTESADGQLLWIDLKSCELSSSEQDTLISINLNEHPRNMDVFACLFREGVVKEVGRSATGNWRLKVVKSRLSAEELNELKEYVSQHMTIGNTEENRNHVAKQLPVTFSRLN